MLKSLIAATVLTFAAITMPAQAEPSQATSPADAASIAAQKCTSGCLIFSPADVQELEGVVNAFGQRAFQAGFAQGAQAAEQEIVTNLPAICKKLEKNKI